MRKLRSKLRGNREILAWAVYDWANSAFAVVVLSGFFPILYRDYWASALDSSKVTLTLAAGTSLSSIVLMLLSVLLGALADAGGRHKSFLIVCMAVGVSATLLLGVIESGGWQVALLVFMLANLAFMLGNVFYDALLVKVSEPGRRERVSALGYALGYLGGGLLFAAMSVMVFYADALGFEGQGSAMRVGFYVTGLWWLLFSLPLIYWVAAPRARSGVRQGLRRFLATLRMLASYPDAAWFLLAYWLYIDGVDTIIRMAVDYGKALGFATSDLILALLLVQFVAFPATLLFGLFAERRGIKPAIFCAIGSYVVICVLGATVESLLDFYLIAVLVGLVQGGIQAQSRAFFSLLIPSDKAAQFFGLYNLLGRFAAIIGPLLLGWVGAATGSPRFGILSVTVLFIAGAAVLWRVPEPARSS